MQKMLHLNASVNDFVSVSISCTSQAQLYAPFGAKRTQYRQSDDIIEHVAKCAVLVLMQPNDSAVPVFSNIFMTNNI